MPPGMVKLRRVKATDLRQGHRKRATSIASQKGQAAIRDWFRASNDRTGNLPLFPGIFPDQMAPIVRNGADGERELVMTRWGMPGPPQFGGAPITNIRNVGSPHWRGWLPALASRMMVIADALGVGLERHHLRSFTLRKSKPRAV
jgi:hypothetical protein